MLNIVKCIEQVANYNELYKQGVLTINNEVHLKREIFKENFSSYQTKDFLLPNYRELYIIINGVKFFTLENREVEDESDQGV